MQYSAVFGDEFANKKHGGISWILRKCIPLGMPTPRFTLDSKNLFSLLKQMPKRIFHRTNANAAESILKYGIIPGGAGGTESGRRHAFFSSCRVGEKGYISGMRADAPIEIAVDLPKAVECGVDFILTDSDAILTSQHVPNTALLWVRDDRTKVTIWTPPGIEERGEGPGVTDSAGFFHTFTDSTVSQCSRSVQHIPIELGGKCHKDVLYSMFILQVAGDTQMLLTVDSCC